MKFLNTTAFTGTSSIIRINMDINQGQAFGHVGYNLLLVL